MKTLIAYQLSNVSIKLITKYGDFLLNKIGNRGGIYVLYRGNNIYYVGKDKHLGIRLKHHFKDRHKNKWNRFSVYVVDKPEYIAPLEKLLISLLKPKGNELLYQKEEKKAAKDLEKEITLFNKQEIKNILQNEKINKNIIVKNKIHKKISNNIRDAQYSLWLSFNKYCKDKYKNINLREPHSRHYHNISVGTGKAHISLSATKDMEDKKYYIGCELYIYRDKNFFRKLYKNKKSIEKELKENLDWRELKNKKASRIIIFKQIDFTKKGNLNKCLKFFSTQTKKFITVFPKYF